MPKRDYNIPHQEASPLLNKLIKRIGLISLVIAIVVQIGWIFNIEIIKSFIPGMATMKFNAALCFMLLGGALVIKKSQPGNLSKYSYQILLLMIILISGITLLQDKLHFDAHIDQLLIADLHTPGNQFPGRMAHNAAASFILMGIGLLGLNYVHGKLRVVCQYLLHVVTLISGVAIMGYIYGVSMLYKLSYVSSMAIHAAILFFFLSVAAAFLNPGLGIARLFTGPGVGNKMAQRHFTALTLVLIVFGSLRIQSERFHILPPEIGISILAISLLLASLVMIWMTANWLNKIDDKRSEAEEEIKRINASLETKVEERSAKLKELYSELKTSEQKYKLLFESNPLPLWIVAKDDMTIIAVNNAAANLYGYTTEELLNKDIKLLRSPAHWDKLIDRYRADIADPLDFGVVEHIKKDGSTILVNIIAQDIMFEGRFVRLSSTSDVTEKLMAEKSLKASEANLQTILNNTDTAYALLNADLEVVEYNNKALIFAQNEFNFEAGDSMRIFDMMPDSRRSQFVAYTDEVFKGNTISYEVNYATTHDSQQWYHVRMFPIADKDEKILGLVLAITDITNRKEAEHDLNEAYQSIRSHINKILEMTWKQSHLIRSPLANLKGLVPMLRSDPSDQEVLKYLEIELERMDEILWEMAEGTSMINIDNKIK